jgi:endogenous inhibitor of DNA gyrase (YacG/DUF329 family)
MAERCPKCGAASTKEAETKCLPDGDSCPAEDLNLWEQNTPKPTPRETRR